VSLRTKGLALAGIEGIAEPTGLNKKMIYHYFGSKEDLYVAVLEQAYMGIRKMEEALPLEDLEPLEAIREACGVDMGLLRRQSRVHCAGQPGKPTWRCVPKEIRHRKTPHQRAL
jgi:AcrR family transcriptional regulator